MYAHVPQPPLYYHDKSKKLKHKVSKCAQSYDYFLKYTNPLKIMHTTRFLSYPHSHRFFSHFQFLSLPQCEKSCNFVADIESTRQKPNLHRYKIKLQ